MSSIQLDYLVFGIVLVIAIILDLGVFSRHSANMTLKKALHQSIFWVSLGLLYCGFMWWQEGDQVALEYLSAYLMEKSLSIDNIFVFILIFQYFRIRADHVPRALLIGVLMAIILRVIFITIGVILVEKFQWILYIFGVVLLITGVKLFVVNEAEDYDPTKNIVYKLVNRFLPIIHKDVSGKMSVMIHGKRHFTNLFIVIILLATTDIVFALDSIPAVFAISQNKLVIYTSNIFAVLGLRALFFLLKGAVAKFEYLQQGIAVVLVFIGLKMLAEIINIHVPIFVSLMVIIICLVTSIFYSIKMNQKKQRL